MYRIPFPFMKDTVWLGKSSNTSAFHRCHTKYVLVQATISAHQFTKSVRHPRQTYRTHVDLSNSTYLPDAIHIFVLGTMNLNVCLT